MKLLTDQNQISNARGLVGLEKKSYLIFLLQALTGLWFSWVSKGRIGELAPSSQDLKGWKKQNKDERQHTPCQRSENILFPAFLQLLQLGLSSAISLKKLTVDPSGKLNERTLFTINQVTQLPTILKTLFKPGNEIYVCSVFHFTEITPSCKSVCICLFQHSQFQQSNDRAHVAHEVNLLPTESMILSETQCYQWKGEESSSMCR